MYREPCHSPSDPEFFVLLGFFPEDTHIDHIGKMRILISIIFNILLQCICKLLF